MPGHGYRPKLSAGGQNQLSTEVKKFIAGRAAWGARAGDESSLREHLRSNQNIGLEGIVTSSDIAAKVMLLAQLPRDCDDQLHRVIRAADDAAAEEESLDVVPLVEIQREPHYFIRRESRALHIARAPIDAVVAVVKARIREQHFQ